MAKLYTYHEVAKHNKEYDLWIVIHGSVYDVTRFVREHPGGEDVLVNAAGTDASECFDAIGHSAEAIQRREGYKIGEVTGSSGGNDNSVAGTSGSANDGDDDWDYVEHKEESSPWPWVFLYVAIVAYSAIFYFLF